MTGQKNNAAGVVGATSAASVKRGRPNRVSVHAPIVARTPGNCQELFQSVKEKISLREAVVFYGFSIKGDFIACPFHSGGHERTPSLHLYGDHFKCFACQQSGDLITFVQKLFNLAKPIDAVKRLNDDFRLGLNLEHHAPTKAERERIRRITQGFERWRTETREKLIEICQTANCALRDGPPWTEREELAIKANAESEYYVDLLDDDEAALKIFLNRKEYGF